MHPLQSVSSVYLFVITVQFSIGTPPSTTWKRSGTVPHLTPPGGSPSPRRRSGELSNWPWYFYHTLPECPLPHTHTDSKKFSDSECLNQIQNLLFRVTVQRISTTPGSLAIVSGTSPLPTILGSPTKGVGALQFTSPGGEEHESPSSPLAVPFGSSRTRAKTCPDNIAAVGYSPDGNRCKFISL